MKTGMNLLLWTSAATEEHLPLISRIKAWGFDGVEIPVFDVNGTPWAKFASALNDFGLGRTAATAPPAGANLISDDAREREAGLGHLKACIDACAEFGAELLCGPLYSPVGHLVGRGPNEDEFARAAEGLRDAGQHAAAAGIALAVEPLNRFETYFLNCQADSARLIDAIGLDNVGILYDTFHANIEEKSLVSAIRSSGKRINHVHISANDRGTPGEDHIDWETNFEALKSIDYDGWLTIESFGSWLPDLAGATCIWRAMAPSAEHVAREGLKHVRACWGGEA